MGTEDRNNLPETGEPQESASSQGALHSPSPEGAVPSLDEDPIGVKERIEKSAIRLFGEKGFAATSVREIVEAAGVTKPSLYYYFKDKDDLYESLIFSTIKSFHEDLAEHLSEPGSVQERLERVAQTHFECVKSDTLTIRFMFRALFGYGPQDPRINFAELAEQNSEMIRNILRKAASQGEISESAVSETAVVQFIGIIHIYMMRNAVGIQDDLSPDLAKKIVDLYLNGLRHSDKF